MFPLILNVKQFDGAWSWQVVEQVVLAPVCVYLCACLQCFYSPTTTTMAIHHTYLNSMQEGRPKYSHLLLAKDGDCKLLPSPWPTSPKSTHPRLQTLARRLASVCLSCPFFRLRPCLLGLDRCCGVLGLAPPFPTDWEEDGGSPGGWILPHTTPAH